MDGPYNEQWCDEQLQETERVLHYLQLRDSLLMPRVCEAQQRARQQAEVTERILRDFNYLIHGAAKYRAFLLESLAVAKPPVDNTARTGGMPVGENGTNMANSPDSVRIAERIEVNEPRAGCSIDAPKTFEAGRVKQGGAQQDGTKQSGTKQSAKQNGAKQNSAKQVGSNSGTYALHDNGVVSINRNGGLSSKLVAPPLQGSAVSRSHRTTPRASLASGTHARHSNPFVNTSAIPSSNTKLASRSPFAKCRQSVVAEELSEARLRVLKRRKIVAERNKKAAERTRLNPQGAPSGSKTSLPSRTEGHPRKRGIMSTAHPSNRTMPGHITSISNDRKQQSNVQPYAQRGPTNNGQQVHGRPRTEQITTSVQVRALRDVRHRVPLTKNESLVGPAVSNARPGLISNTPYTVASSTHPSRVNRTNTTGASNQFHKPGAVQVHLGPRMLAPAGTRVQRSSPRWSFSGRSLHRIAES